MSDGGKALAAALGRVPSGLFVVTVRQGTAETGMLASWVQQCSFEPPQLSLAIRRDRAVSGWLTPGTAFTVNLLAEGQNDLLCHFGRGFEPGEEAFAGLDLDRPGGAPPVLRRALAYLECRVSERVAAGDHDLILGRVVAGAVLHHGRPYVHIRKNGLHY
jgi:flavin reductase (DIM6/NTAB) family NADH-FMN oxidoreductase RutF